MTQTARFSYADMADSLAVDIRAGRLQEGDRLPAARVLATQFGVTPVTARNALKELARRGLARANSTRGYFVEISDDAESESLAQQLAIVTERLDQLSGEPSHSAEYLAISERLQSLDRSVQDLASRLADLERSAGARSGE